MRRDTAVGPSVPAGRPGLGSDQGRLHSLPAPGRAASETCPGTQLQGRRVSPRVDLRPGASCPQAGAFGHQPHTPRWANLQFQGGPAGVCGWGMGRASLPVLSDIPPRTQRLREPGSPGPCRTPLVPSGNSDRVSPARGAEGARGCSSSPLCTPCWVIPTSQDAGSVITSPIVQVRPSQEQESRDAPGHSSRETLWPLCPLWLRKWCRQLGGSGCRGREAREPAPRLPLLWVTGQAGLRRNRGGEAGARRARPCRLRAGAGPPLLASRRSGPACLGAALRLDDEGQALCVFPSPGWPTLAGTAWRESLPGPAGRQLPAPEGGCCGWTARALSWPGDLLGEEPPGGLGDLILDVPAHREHRGNSSCQPGISGLILSDILGSR